MPVTSDYFSLHNSASFDHFQAFLAVQLYLSQTGRLFGHPTSADNREAMKVLHISFSDLSGGGNLAAYRLHTALRAAGVNSSMLVAKKLSDDPHVIQHPLFGSKYLRAVRSQVEPRLVQLSARRQVRQFSIGFIGGSPKKLIAHHSPNLINMHWINGGFISIQDIAAMGRPLVWTLHDMWGFTGGCHYAYDCDGYTEQCGNCPQLGAVKGVDLSRKVFLKKQNLWSDMSVQLVTPSRWLQGCATRSSLFKEQSIEVIPNGLDTSIFQPFERATARARFNIDQAVPLLCYGAIASLSDLRKGYDLLLSALRNIGSKLVDIGAEILIFGTPEEKVETDSNFGVRCHHVGHLRSPDDVARAYSSADVFVAPSRADNLPNTVVESIACGTPVASFSIGGIPEIIRSGENGILADPYSTEQLGAGIFQLLNDPVSENRRKLISEKALAKYSHEIQAQRYMKLYQRLY